MINAYSDLTNNTFELIQVMYVFLFVFVFAIKLIRTEKKGIRPFLVLDTSKSLKQRIYEITPIIAVTILIFSVLGRFFGWRYILYGVFVLPVHWGVSLIGIVIGGVSFVFLILGYYKLGDNWRIGSGEEEQKKLITDSIFSVTRNPVYIFFNGFSFSFFLMTGDVLYLVLWVCICLALHKIILQEEANLRKVFPQEYRIYETTVPRYVSGRIFGKNTR